MKRGKRMPAWRYLFVSELGRVCGSTDAPTEQDLAFADVGLLAIIDLVEGRYYGEGRWPAIPAGRLVRVDDRTAVVRSFHEPAPSRR